MQTNTSTASSNVDNKNSLLVCLKCINVCLSSLVALTANNEANSIVELADLVQPLYNSVNSISKVEEKDHTLAFIIQVLDHLHKKRNLAQFSLATSFHHNSKDMLTVVFSLFFQLGKFSFHIVVHSLNLAFIAAKIISLRNNMRLRKLLAKVLNLHTAGALAGIKQILIKTQHCLLGFSTRQIECHSTITCHKFSTVHSAKIPKVVQCVKVGHKTKCLHLQRRSSNRSRRNKNLVALDLQRNQHPTVAGISTLALVPFVHNNKSVGFKLEFGHFTLGILIERLHRILQLLPLHVFGIASTKLFIVDHSNSLKLEDL